MFWRNTELTIITQKELTLFRRVLSKYPSRYYGFSISYRLGELKASVKKAARSIDNDDVKGGGGGGGNTGGGGGQ